MIELNVKGTGVALVTPFDREGDIDTAGLRKMVNYVIDGGVDYIVALGTTAETPVLSKEEKRLVVNIIIEESRNRIPIVLGMGGNDTSRLVNEIKSADFTGISGILSVAPYYNKPTQEGIYRHFSAIAEVSPLPVILYNVPGRTSSNISAATCLRLAKDYSNIIAVKEASGDFNQLMEIIRNKPEHFEVVSGDDAITFPMTTLGGGGVISVVANAFPSEFSTMVRQCLENDLEPAREIHYKLLPLINLMFEEGNPAGVKAFLEIMGVTGSNVRLPLLPASKGLKEKIESALS